MSRENWNVAYFKWNVVETNSATMVCLLSACSSFSELKLGRWAAVFIDVNSIPLNAILTTALLDMYCKCEDVEKAREPFLWDFCLSGKNLVSWNAMITGYVQCGFLEEAIGLFNLMRARLVKPNEIAMVNILSACAGLGKLELGKEVHRYICRNKLDMNVIVATALVDMYSKCGSVNDACLVFVKTANKDVAFWNAMIASLAYHGNGKDSIVLTQIERSGVNPNDITFIGVLSACNPNWCQPIKNNGGYCLVFLWIWLMCQCGNIVVVAFTETAPGGHIS